MEQTDTAKEWFVTHEGKQFGPVSFEDLRFEVKRGGLDPRLDMVWKEGMGNWIHAGELEGLFVENTDAPGGEADGAPTGTSATHAAPETAEKREQTRGNWPGVGRGPYLFIALMIPVILGLGLSALKSGLSGKIEPTFLGYVDPGVLVISTLIVVFVSLARLRNLAMSRWWYLATLVPFIYPWLQYRMFACPPGYAQHKKIDTVGWILAFIFWAIFLIIVSAIGYVAYLLTQSAPDDSQRLMIEGFVGKLKEAREQAGGAGISP